MLSSVPSMDPNFINDVVDKLKKQGLFDKFRKDCLSDVDTKVWSQFLALPTSLQRQSSNG